MIHLYLGWRHVLSAALVGLAYGAGATAAGSLLPVMLLHFLQDLSATDVLAARKEEAASSPV